MGVLPPCQDSWPWLPVMANIAPPDLRRRASADTLIRRTEAHNRGTYEIPLMSDIYDHPTYRLLSRSPAWTRLQAEEYDIVEEWTNQWQHSDVSNAMTPQYLYQDSRTRHFLEVNGFC